MNEEPEKLTDASPDDVAHALAFALRFNGRKRVHTADDFMAQITAERLMEQLRLSGFVIKKKPPTPSHSDTGFRTPTND